MSSVLFDVPGPRARRRNLIATLVFGALFAGLLALIGYRLYREGEFDAEVWEEMSQPNIWRAIGDGIVATLQAAAAAIVLSMVFGAVCAIGRLSDHAWVRAPFVLIVEFFRAVPVILLMIVFYIGFDFSPYWAVVTALVLYNGSVLSEVFRAGLLAVPRGQSEAAYAIGMRKNQVLGSVLFPQAVRIMLPTIISQCVVVLKDTALGNFVVYSELLDQAENIAQFIGYNFVPLMLVTVIYIVINYSLSKLAEYVERRMGRAKLGRVDAEPAPTGMATGA
jgi:glutamate transport system permease protein